ERIEQDYGCPVIQNNFELPHYRILGNLDAYDTHGRTAFIANIAVLLAKQGKRVLVIDWDLEAPGLTRYFKTFIPDPLTQSYGLIHLLNKVIIDPSTKWESYITQVRIEDTSPIALIPSGDLSDDYVENVRSFSWTDFFEKSHGGVILDRWRREWKENFDFVLIDSRTGITDAGGVCTIFLPDFLVLVFTTNEQSFERGIQIALGVQDARRKLDVPRPPVSILPLLGRFDGRDEVDESKKWIERFGKELKRFYDDWLPKQFEARQMLELTKIPYVTKFSFGEPLPVITHGISDPELPGFYLNNITRLLVSDFREAAQILSPKPKEESFSELRAELVHVPIDEAKINQMLSAIESDIGPGSKLSELLNEAGVAFMQQKNYLSAESLFRRSQLINEELFGLESPEGITSLNNLALLLRDQNRYSESEQLYQRSLLISEKQFGYDHPNIATVLSNLALLYQRQGKFKDAESLYTRALSIYEKSFGEDHPNVATSMHNLAELYYNQDNFEETIPLLVRSLAIYEKSLGTDHPNVAQSLNNLGWVYAKQGDYKTAEPLYKRALAIYEKSLGPDHPNVATTIHNLADLYHDEGKNDEAEPLLKRLIDIYEKVLGPDHLNVASCTYDLAQLYYSQNEYEKAETLYKRSLMITEKSLGTDHPNVGIGLVSLAGVYAKQERYTEAESVLMQSLGIFEKSLGYDHPNVTAVLSTMASLCQLIGDEQRAILFSNMAEEIDKKNKERNSPH
ncbi:MAG: tetratricopeptide repeat protein, partial [Chlorobiales bacterium]|nr:tetratricopeptide repeat protein [Chlorobiales bacterium]